MTRFSDVIHEWLGLCPDRYAVKTRNAALPFEMDSQAHEKNRTYINDGVVVDYGTGRITKWFIIGVVVALFGIVLVFPFIVKGISFRQASTLFSVFLLLFAIVTLYRDIKKARLEIRPDTLILHRPFHKPVVILRDDIATVEIRQNALPYPLWHQKILNVCVIPTCSAAIILIEYWDLISGEITSSRFLLDLIFYINLILLFLVFYNHSRVRSFPEKGVIITNRKERITVFSENPGEITRLLEKTP
ncbi:MAG: DUF1673 family protein [Methanoregula sp.]|nr:DUF1673 family protein [Methanoregula sp.]